MIKIHSRNVTQIFAVYSLGCAIKLKKGDVFIPVDFITGRKSYSAAKRVSFHFFLMNTKEKAKVANVETFGMILLWKGCKVPRFKPVLTKLNRFNSFKLCLSNEFINFFFVHAMILIIEQVLLLSIVIVFSLFLLTLPVKFSFLVHDFLWVDFKRLFSNPSIISSV